MLTRKQTTALVVILALVAIYFLFFRKKNGTSSWTKKKSGNNNESNMGGGGGGSPSPIVIYGTPSPYPMGYPYGYQGAYPSGWGGAGLIDPLTIAYEEMMVQSLKPKICKCGTDKDGRNITCNGKTDISGNLVCTCCGGKK